MTSEPFLCVRCRRPVRVSAPQFETFERMHYVCFHYEFEHDPTDPDEVCASGGCPTGAVVGGREHLMATLNNLVREAGDLSDWENRTVSDYLKALAGWLADSDGFYVNRHQVPPSNPWETMSDALQGAKIYE